MARMIDVLAKYNKSSKKNKIGGKKKKTHEEYVKELAIKNPTVEAVEEYKGAKTKIEHHCLIHDVYWDILPSNALKGQGCVKCCKERIGNKNSKSYEQYIEELKNVHSNISHIGKYIDASTPTLHKCNIDKYEWMATPTSILRGQGCPKCANNIKWTHEQYVFEAKNTNNNIEVLEEYINMRTPILHLCKKHNIQWKTTPSRILSGCGCIECKKEKIKITQSKSDETYINELKTIAPTIMPLEEYINSHTPILHKCLIDGYEWRTSPTNIFGGSGCLKCSNRIQITNEIYIDKVSEVNKNIEVLESYINMSTPILHRCKIHNIEWKVLPYSILRGSGCIKCGIEKVTSQLVKSNEQYVEELSICNPKIIALENYINGTTPILHRCLIDGHEWKLSPNNALFGYGCPKCSSSKGEKQICQWLDNNNILYESQKKFDDCKDKSYLPFDFYIPSKNMCIEYDGEQHFRPVDFFGGQEGFEIRQRHDNIKNEYCKNNDIPLLRIPYYKINNIEEELNNFLFI